MKLLSSLLVGTLPLLIGSATAAVVNFDFNVRLDNDDDSNVVPETYVGLGAAPDSVSNTHWNSVRRTSSLNVSSAAAINNPILDSSGLVSTVDVQITTTAAIAGIGHQRTAGMQELGTSGSYTNLMSDFIQLDAIGADTGAVATANGIFTGLAATSIYEIYFYGQGELYGPGGNANSGQNSFFGITSTPGGAVTGESGQTGWTASNGVLTDGIEYVKLTATSNEFGEIFFTWRNVVAGAQYTPIDKAGDAGGSSSDYAALNGIQIVSVVPEASSALLGMLGLSGLLLRRRR